MKSIIAGTVIGEKKISMPAKAAFTRQIKGPKLHVVVAMLGRDKIITRLQIMLQNMNEVKISLRIYDVLIKSREGFVPENERRVDIY